MSELLEFVYLKLLEFAITKYNICSGTTSTKFLAKRCTARQVDFDLSKAMQGKVF